MPIPSYNYAALPTPQYPNAQAELELALNAPTPYSDMLKAIQQGLTFGTDMVGKQKDLKSKDMQQQLQKIGLQYAPQEEQADLQSKQLNNSILQNTLKYAPQNSQADIAYRLAVAQSAPLNAQANITNAGRMNNPNYLMTKLMNNPSFLDMMNKDPELAKSVATAMGNIGTSAGQSLPQPGMPQQVAPPSPNGPLTVNPNPQQANALIASGVATPGPGYKPSPELINSLQQTAGDSAMQKTMTTQQRNQIMYANTLDKIFSQGDMEIPSAAQYAGLLGEN